VRINWLKWAVGLTILLNIIDLIVSKRILVGESNPIYLLFRSYWVLVLIKLGVIGIMILLYRRYKKMGNKSQFFVSMFFVYLIIALSIAIYMNVTMPQEHIDILEVERSGLEEQVEQGNETAEQVIKATDKKSFNFYGLFVASAVYYPMLFGFLSFCLWESSNKWFKGGEENR